MTGRISLQFLAISVLLGSIVSGLLSDTEVTVGDLGDIVGSIEYTEWSNRTVFSFRGIPYAEPPIGDLRFSPPVQITSWNGTLDATSYGPSCPRRDVSVYSEDCLTINVFVPKIENSDNDTTELLPVMIFIHGGTFRSGDAAKYVPLRFLYEADLIAVVPQFRLGFLGLFSLQTDDVPGNVQFLDQIMAMQWVQDNIEYFGGNKSRVTLYGHSSGAASVHFHLLSPLAEGLFHRTILQSGSALRTYGVDTNPIESALTLSNYCGCQNITDAGEIATCMRELSTDEVLKCSGSYLDSTIYDGLTRARSHMAVVQVAGERKFLTEDPKELMAKGEFIKLPMIAGVTKHDGSSHFQDIYDEILEPYGLINDTDYAQHNLTAYVLKYLGLSDITSSVTYTMIKTYFEENDIGDLITMAPGLIDICSLISYKSGSYETVYANRLLEKTYVYTFEYDVYDPDADNPLYPFNTGVDHGEDTALLFAEEDYRKENDIEMAKVLLKLWTTFVIDEVPTAEGVTWPVMSTDFGPYLVIDSTLSVKENFLNEFITRGGATSIRISSWHCLIFVACYLSGRTFLH